MGGVFVVKKQISILVQNEDWLLLRKEAARLKIPITKLVLGVVEVLASNLRQRGLIEDDPELLDEVEKLRQIIAVAHKHGRNGVENPKDLVTFLDEFLPASCES